MTQIESIVEGLKRDVEMMKMTLADFSDAEMLVRPVPGANHAAWQIGHLAMAESNMVNAAQAGAAPPPPAVFADKFKKAMATVDDPAFFPKKAELLDTLTNVRLGTIAWAKTLKPENLDQKMPPAMERFAPTVGYMLGMLPFHVGMHLGQFQVIRRKLGKPILF